MNIYFKKLFSVFHQPQLLVTDGGGKPLIIIEEAQMKELIKEWKKEQETKPSVKEPSVKEEKLISKDAISCPICGTLNWVTLRCMDRRRCINEHEFKIKEP